ncbi:MAG: hypothetical protein ACREN2_13495 [Candidatus Dormibacteria bacterium]
MSYDIDLIIDTGGPEPARLTSRNQTSNVSCMWRHAGADLAEFDGRTAVEALPALRIAIAAIEDDPGTYKAMNPANGWGDYDSCLEFLRELVKDFTAHPKATVVVSR